MGKKLEVFIDGCVTRPVQFVCNKIIKAGYAGRNQNEVRKHVEELKKLGVPAPDRVPTYYPKPGYLLRCAEQLEVVDTDSSGEAEFVLLVASENVYVAAGSDHTDRNLEATSAILKAKQMYPSLISRAVWRLSDVEDHWDEIALRAWINAEEKQIYQDAKLAALLPPRELLERVRPLVGGDLVGTAIYSGTVATIGEIRFSNRFEAQLVDSHRGQTLECGYSVEPISWFQVSGKAASATS